ncbi:hypothetical protein GXP70_18185 [Paenibacillus lycopersici]|uniref:Uncharacterized protein n=1 Tax=Paenibacillus lycopersici TaxID=2704462 RepID=A0A6C0G044_9BACL|nr:hypothetical protein [Paenibacillus lycopersici]QHT61712.1 hypothetical protein GXP70_18185 [Paenibacillus lycopersici]
MSIYISPEHYEQAAAIGISSKNVYQRVHQYGWSVDRAISELPMKRSLELPEHWLVVAAANGISRRKYARRIAAGYTEEDAATLTHEEAIKLRAERQRKVSLADIERAEALGLTAHSLRERLRNGWSKADALTLPKFERCARGDFGGLRRKEAKHL